MSSPPSSDPASALKLRLTQRLDIHSCATGLIDLNSQPCRFAGLFRAPLPLVRDVPFDPARAALQQQRHQTPVGAPLRLPAGGFLSRRCAGPAAAPAAGSGLAMALQRRPEAGMERGELRDWLKRAWARRVQGPRQKAVPAGGRACGSAMAGRHTAVRSRRTAHFTQITLQPMPPSPCSASATRST